EARADATGPCADRVAAGWTHRRRGERAHADDLCRAPLPELRLRRGAVEVEEVRVRVSVDEAGRHDVAAGVDHSARFALAPGADGDDAVALHGDVRPARGCAGAVDQGAVPDEQRPDRKSTRLNSSQEWNSYAVFCLK